MWHLAWDKAFANGMGLIWEEMHRLPFWSASRVELKMPQCLAHWEHVQKRRRLLVHVRSNVPNLLLLLKNLIAPPLEKISCAWNCGTDFPFLHPCYSCPSPASEPFISCLLFSWFPWLSFSLNIMSRAVKNSFTNINGSCSIPSRNMKRHI